MPETPVKGAPEPLTVPRLYWVLIALGPAVLFVGVMLSVLLDRPSIAYVSFAIWVAAWIARGISLFWGDATGPITRVAAVVRPLALAMGFTLALMTEWFWWFLVGFVLYAGILPAARLVERRAVVSDPSTGGYEDSNPDVSL